MPRYVNRLQLYEGKEPLFHKYRLDEEIAKIHARRVPLKAGGSIVIDQTEALVAIDVNSGSFRAEDDAEETAYQMNIHRGQGDRPATPAPRPGRRDRQRLHRHAQGAAPPRRRAGAARRRARDRARTKILRTSPFGLIEMTRQRIRPSLKRSAYTDCPCCRGSGVVKTPESMAIDVVRLLIVASQQPSIVKVAVTVAEDVADYLNNRKRHELARLEDEGSMNVQIVSDEHAGPEHLVFQYWDADSREVKFP